MMSKEEVAFLYNLARSFYTGRGVIVAAGIFLGASTLAFGNGVRENPAAPRALNDSKPIHSYDLCVTDAGMMRQIARRRNALALEGHSFAEGESFEPYLREAI